MNLNSQQTRIAGIGLIALAVVIIFNLWSLIPVVLLAGGGAYIYRREHSAGRINSAIQGGLWGFGLALLYLIDFVLPGILLLAGTSLLLRGKEEQADVRVQNTLRRLPRRRIAQSTPVAPSVNNSENSRANDTVRLS
jgi:hypothetical protein